MCKVAIRPQACILDELQQHVLESKDIYGAAALYPKLVQYYGSNSNAVLMLERLFASRQRYRRILAAAQFTPLEVMSWLVRDNETLCLNKLAMNLATPLPILSKLMVRAPIERQLRLARHPTMSTELLARLPMQHPEIRHALCRNPNTGIAQLRQLAQNVSLVEAQCLALNPHADGELLINLWQRFDDPFLHANLATNGQLPASLRGLTLTSDSPLIRRKTAANPSLTKAQQHLLLADTQYTVRAAMVRYASIRSDHREVDEHYRVRRVYARCAGLDTATLAHLSKDRDAWVRRWVARNPSTGSVVLKALALDSEPQVRRGITRNDVTSLSLLEQLSQDRDAWVRAGVAYRSDISISIIERLSHDTSDDVLAGLASNLHCPQLLLQRLSQHTSADVRRAVINNSVTSSEILMNLVEDPYGFNRAQLCINPRLPERALWHLLDDPEAQVRFNVVTRLSGLE